MQSRKRHVIAPLEPGSKANAPPAGSAALRLPSTSLANIVAHRPLWPDSLSLADWLDVARRGRRRIHRGIANVAQIAADLHSPVVN